MNLVKASKLVKDSLTYSVSVHEVNFVWLRQTPTTNEVHVTVPKHELSDYNQLMYEFTEAMDDNRFTVYIHDGEQYVAPTDAKELYVRDIGWIQGG